MSGPENKPSSDEALLYMIGIGAFAFVLTRFAPGLGLTLMALTILGAAAYYGRKLYDKIKATKARPSDADGYRKRVKSRYDDCRAKEDQFRSEAERIRLSIADLRTDIAASPQADAAELERAQTLIAELEAEFNLRHAKAAFFADCAAKLKALLDRHHLQQSIASRKRELDALRARNFDDEASLEETRYHLERDTIELDTIAELSKEAFVSFKAEQAEELRLRLEKLRSKL